MQEQQQEHWSKIEERGSVLGMKCLFFIYRLLGRYVLWVFLFPVVLYFYLTGTKARKASKVFLTKVLQLNSGNKNVTATSWQGLKHFCQFADSAFDKLDAWLGKITAEQVIYNDANVMKNIAVQGKGAIFIGSHLGNLEVCRALSYGRYATKINVLVFTENAVKFNRLLNKTNPNVMVNLIQVTSINPAMAINLKEKVDAGEIIVIVGDRTSVTVEGRVIYQPFLETSAPFAQGPFILAALLNCPVYWLFCLKEKQHFKVIFEHVSDGIELPRKQRQAVLSQLVADYATRLGYYAQQYPYQWFNFFDFWQSDKAVKRKLESGVEQ
ncbi:MAG: acyltransferase [Cognaticolwellia aestuarii]